MKRLKPVLIGLAVALFWGLVWQAAAWCVAKPLLFPSPVAVIASLSTLLFTAEFWLCTGMTFLRILIGIVAAFLLGILLGALTARIGLLNTLLSPLLSGIKSTPVASFILLLLIFIGRDILPSVITALIVLPVVWANVSEGLKNVDCGLLEVTRIFRFSRAKTLHVLYIPSLMPYILSACRSSLGLAWKAGIAAEVLAVPSHSIGKHLYEAKLYFETEDLFAWTLSVIVLSLLIESVALKLIARVAPTRPAGEVRA